ncbi:MAG: glycoside hydrolase family 99-like domain-containing protein [Bacteroidales bacterium]|nr:glycoside hydrolase family 99-like domain-containing protein [Bacteroidales bacterium]
MTRFIAFYLPQFHPTPENDEWWGKGFTEWTNVARAEKLFRGHYQPKIPGELGFYDLRMPEVRKAQADLAREYGIEGFCYWHYWFGNGKRLLQRPFDEVVASGEPDFPFCLAWANHSWAKKQFDKNGTQQLLMQQTYPGEEDFRLHFQTMLPAFKDHRYIKVDGKLLFVIYNPLDDESIYKVMLPLWQKLAKENGLEGFYFVGKSDKGRLYKEIIEAGYDAVYNDSLHNIHHKQTLLKKIWLEFVTRILRRPMVFQYKDAIKYMIGEDASAENVFPVVGPNWDHTPRSGGNGMLFHDCNPKYFKKLVKKAIEAVHGKNYDHQVIMIKAWNEWGEGNYMEPDLRYGRGYLEALKEASNDRL